MPISYRDAGVDLDAGEALVRRIGPLARATRTAGVVADVGGFAGLFAVPSGMSDPVLVSGTDGVGTKLEVAFATGVHDTVGLDLVAMCVNDVVTTGARPLFFLDDFACGKLEVDLAEAVVRGIAEGCKLAGCALLGGETAELASYRRPALFELLADGGPVEEAELRRTFNLGVGLVVAVAPDAAGEALAALSDAGESAWILGDVIASSSAATVFA